MEACQRRPSVVRIAAVRDMLHESRAKCSLRECHRAREEHHHRLRMHRASLDRSEVMAEFADKMRQENTETPDTESAEPDTSVDSGGEVESDTAEANTEVEADEPDEPKTFMSPGKKEKDKKP